MPPDGKTTATSDNEIKGQVAVGSYHFQFGDRNGGVVSVAPRAWGRQFSKRGTPVDLRPRPFLALLDREGEMATLKAAVHVSRHVSLFGPAGIGKTSLLRSLAHLPETDQFPDGLVYLSVFEVGLEDVLQFLFDAFYECRANLKPTLAEIRAALGDIKALILLDNLNLTREESNELLASAPGCTFVLASLERILWGKGELVELGGLPLEESLDLFVLELNRSLNKHEQAAVSEVCRLLGGNPLRIVQVASLVREHKLSIDDLRDRLPDSSADEFIFQTVWDSSPDSHRAILAVLAITGGAALPVNLLEAFSPSEELKTDLQHLVALGLVQAQDARLRLAGNLFAVTEQLPDLASRETRWIKFLTGWLAKRPGQPLLEASVDLLVKIIQKAEQKNRWQDVLRIGQGLESILIVTRRWQSWQKVLRQMLKAARALGDRKNEAFALHQLGTRAACLGPDAEARGFLTQALQLRETLGDRGGLGITRNNLQALFNLPLPADVRPARARRCLNFAVIAAGILLAGTAAAAGLVLLYLNRSTSLPPVAGVPVTNPAATTHPSPAGSPVPGLPAFTLAPTQAPPATVLLDFVAEADTAVWESSETFDPDDNVFGECELTFGAPSAQACGFARWENTVLEDGSQYEKVLVVEPYHANGAQIQATYDVTDLAISRGDRLVVTVGFVENAVTLGVAFSVLFTTGEPGSTPVVVYATRDRNDGRLVDVDIPLPDQLAGQRGYFILHVVAVPNTEANWASWAVARLERP